MNKKEKHMLKVRDKVRHLYMNSDIGMEEILEVIADDSCYFTQYDDVDNRVHNFWLHIERELKKWKKENKGKSLKIYSPDWHKADENKVWSNSIEIS